MFCRALRKAASRSGMRCLLAYMPSSAAIVTSSGVLCMQGCHVQVNVKRGSHDSLIRGPLYGLSGVFLFL